MAKKKVIYKRIQLRVIFAFILISLVAAVVRFIHLETSPPSLNWDEVSHGYNAYSLMKTGKDQWGKSWPLFNFRAYGDYPMVLNMYLTIPSIKLFGLNEFGIRFPSAFLGFLTVIISFFLGQTIFASHTPSLLLTFLVAISPWMVLPSRAVFQSTVAQFFLISGITLFFYAFRKGKVYFLPLATFFWAISAYGYHNTRVISPLLFLGTLFVWWREIRVSLRKRSFWWFGALVIFLLFSVPQLINLFSPESRARGQWVFLIDQGAISKINEQRGLFSGNKFLARLLYNKITYFVPQFAENFLSYFDPKNLFFKGGDHYQFSVPDFGVLPVLGLPFFYLGAIWLFKTAISGEKKSLFLLGWLILGLLPASVTKGKFQVIRASSILPLPQILIVYGLLLVFNWLKKRSYAEGKLILIIFVVGCLIDFGRWWINFNNFYRIYYSWAWQYGYKEAVGFVEENYDKYDKIVITKKYGEPHEFVLFYWPWDPVAYQRDPRKVWDYHAHWYWVDAFDKFEFWNNWEVKEKLKTTGKNSKLLLVTSPKNWIEGGRLLKTIYFLDGTPAFEIIEY